MALGKGLGSLIPQKPISHAPSAQHAAVIVDTNQRVLEISPDAITVNPHQPRTHFDPSELENLMNSIKVHGIISPLVVTDKKDGTYELIAGERRLRSAKTLKLAKVPVIVREAGEQEKLEIAIIENIQRKQLNAIDEARSYNRLMNEFNLTQEEIAHRVGKSRSTIANMLRLLELPPQVIQAIIDEKITEGHARAIASLPTIVAQLALLNKIIENKISVRETEAQVKAVKPMSRKSFDPLVAEYEQKLTQALGTKVTIVKKGEKGSISMNYSTLEDFKSIIDKLLH